MNHSWILSATDLQIHWTSRYLEAQLKNEQGSYLYNRIFIHPLLENKCLINENGHWKYQLSKQEEKEIMESLCPLFQGPTFSFIDISDCYMLTCSPLYDSVRTETLSLLESVTLPPVYLHFGYTLSTVQQSRFYSLMKKTVRRPELVCGMLEMFEKFINTYSSDPLRSTRWLLYLEDDVRLLHSEHKDLTRLYQVPSDAELIRPYIGDPTYCSLETMQYRISFGGGYNHAFYISWTGCTKVLDYVNKYGWFYECDIDLYKLAIGCPSFPLGYDGWSFQSSENQNKITDLLNPSDQIYMYSTSHILFNQTSLPCV